MSWYSDLDLLAVHPEPREVQTSLKELVPTEDGGAVLMMRRWDGRTPQRDGG